MVLAYVSNKQTHYSWKGQGGKDSVVVGFLSTPHKLQPFENREPYLENKKYAPITLVCERSLTTPRDT